MSAYNYIELFVINHLFILSMIILIINAKYRGFIKVKGSHLRLLM